MDRQSPVADPVGPNWGPKGRKKLFGARTPPISKGLDDRGPPPPPPLSQSLDPALR